MNAPCAQGVAGFLSKSTGSFKLSDVTISSQNDYAAISVVSLDGKPIAKSGQVLVQVGTVVRPTGWKQEAATHKSEDGKQTLQGWNVIDTGTMPWQVTNTAVTLQVRNAGLTKAMLLDTAGYPVGPIADVSSAGGVLTVHLPSNALYVILQ
jgi:hypothetical protein